MKPIHEQEWHVGKGGLSVQDSDGAVRAMARQDGQRPEEALRVARVIAATPEMARRLREIHRVPANERGEVVLDGEFIDALGDLLRKAGVPL